MVRMELREDEIEAGSELFGEAVRLLLSDEVQALVTAAAAGELLWEIVKGLAALGKRFTVYKPAAKCLMAARAKEEAGLNDELLEITKVWGLHDRYCLSERAEKSSNLLVYYVLSGRGTSFVGHTDAG